MMFHQNQLFCLIPGLTVAGWAEFRNNSALPCVGLTEVTQGFTPFTGRRTIPTPVRPVLTCDVIVTLPTSHDAEDRGSIRQSSVGHAPSRPIPEDQAHAPAIPADHAPSVLPDEACINRTESPSDAPSSQPSPRSASSSSPSRLSQEGHEQLSEAVSRGVSSHQVSPALSDLPRPNHLNLDPVERRSSISPRHPLAASQSRRSATRREPLLSGSGHYQARPHREIEVYRPLETGPKMANRAYNSPPNTPNSPSPPSSFSSSLFTISPEQVPAIVRAHEKDDDSRHCYFLQITLRPLFSHDVIPGICLRKLPRLVNGIPLGAGFLSRDQLCGIRWRLVEGGHAPVTFVSCPLLEEEAVESKNCLRDRLIKQSQAVFGDLTVKASITLSRCIDMEDDFVLNDIAVNLEEGLHFRD